MEHFFISTPSSQRNDEYYSLNMLINQDEKQTSCFLDGKSLGNPANSC